MESNLLSSEQKILISAGLVLRLLFSFLAWPYDIPISSWLDASDTCLLAKTKTKRSSDTGFS